MEEKEDKNNIEEKLEDFEEELEGLGRKIENRFSGKKGSYRGPDRFFEKFGIIGPFLSGMLGVIFLGLLILGIRFLNLVLRSLFLNNLQEFFVANIGLFFIIFMFSSYHKYFSRKYYSGYKFLKPIAVAISIGIALWVINNLLRIIYASVEFLLFLRIAQAIASNLYNLMIFVALLGYLFLLINLGTKKKDDPVEEKESEGDKMEEERSEKVKRVYRSGKDKVLGGVCGGIGEYLNVDPVLIRLAWVASVLIWGFGILLYILAWIIIPRNPEHEWN